MTERIFVTGAGGFVGRHLVHALAAYGAEIRIVAGRHGASPGASGQDPVAACETVDLDITDPGQVRAAIRSVRPTAVVHLAAIAALQEARLDPERTFRINLIGTMTLAGAVMREAPEARFLFVGTSEVYGGTFKARTSALDEAALLDPTNPYAASKAAADLLVGQMARDGLRSVRLRPFNHTGPGQTTAFVVPAFAAQVARIEAGLQPPTLQVGNLDALRDFLDVRDVVDAYVRAIFLPDLASGTILNIASGVPRRIGDALEGLRALARREIRIEPDPARMRPNDTPLAIGDASRARAALGWAPRIAWETTLADTLDFWRETVAREGSG
ncbi:GDP-mannose 4,6-dehydratase [Methylobacterium planeticum]|uniref:NAD-dependent epimerase/dehydratase family protein n=1 Tax=Methylobacterium planeticum TaxID=2615211 RepID=A0A6N6MT93_9HYPH|nr:GDP-mannose 4,6-dehydratase [Methylobacterium planeticum]KAB1075098.1 NAD-dependent epimerase/dehydratase family protein [Methylobacterium planeticum]